MLLENIRRPGDRGPGLSDPLLGRRKLRRCLAALRPCLVEPGLRLRGYLEEEALWRLEPGAEGRFIADDPAQAALPVRLSEVDATGVAYLELEALASDRQGPIAVRRNAQQRAEPLQAQYGVRLNLLKKDGDTMLDCPQRGLVVLQGRGESLLGRLWRRLAALGIRESGF